MKSSPQPTGKQQKGIAGLFDNSERKELFRKYLFFLGWVEVLILAACYLYSLGDGGLDRSISVESAFPWKAYFLVSFLAPVAISFVIGLVVVGFNNYFIGTESDPEAVPIAEDATDHFAGERTGRIYQLHRVVTWVQKLPFLALLLLLGVTAGFFYKLDNFLDFLGNVGEKSLKVFLFSAAILLIVASVFAFILIILNYQLRKRAMAYQYRSEMADRFGLIILDDNTVLNSEGKLLVQGKGWKESLPMLPARSKSAPEEASPRTFGTSIDIETS